MAHEKFSVRFHLILLSFVISILVLVFSGNLLTCLIGWDGLGLSSYLLVIYYYNIKAYNAGLLTALTNRVGDAFFLVRIALRFYFMGWGFIQRFKPIRINFSVLISFIIITAGCTKRAQIPFSAWLPAAMAAPTPVSSLVHSSTLVTAGVFLIFRFSGILSSPALAVLLALGLSTSLMAGLAAILEIDIKKVVALSTLRQLGLIITSLGGALPELAFFHLISHAFLKALLFLRIGRCISQVSGLQDLRLSSLRIYSSPLTRAILLRASLGLCGLPFIGAFYSKDLLIEIIITLTYGAFTKFFLFLTIIVTPIYSIRLIIFIVSSRGMGSSLRNHPENQKSLYQAFLLLAPVAIIRAAIIQWICLEYQPSPRINILQKISTLGLVSLGVVMGRLISLSPYTIKKSLISSSLRTLFRLRVITPRRLSQLSLPVSALERSLIDQFMTQKLYCLGPRQLPLSREQNFAPKNLIIKPIFLVIVLRILCAGWVYICLPNLSGQG